ncbi:unnamed protein product [Penicillium salamii]|nr:unnamed protein product [Penicillium salamii]
MFTFLVGTDKRGRQVHSTIVSSASLVLNVLTNGKMREFRENLVNRSHVDEPTFNQFCEFLYSGDYTVPSPLLDFALATEQNETSQSSNNTAGFNTAEQAATEAVVNFLGRLSRGRNGKRDDQLKLLQRRLPEFEGLEIPSPEELACFYNFSDRWMPQGDSRVQDWTPFFVEQVQLYVLANVYGVIPLCYPVLLRIYGFHLSHILCSGPRGSRMESIIVACLGMVDENTPPNYGLIDPMRNLAVRFVVTAMQELEWRDAFRELVREYGDFSLDLWGAIWDN